MKFGSVLVSTCRLIYDCSMWLVVVVQLFQKFSFLQFAFCDFTRSFTFSQKFYPICGMAPLYLLGVVCGPNGLNEIFHESGCG